MKAEVPDAAQVVLPLLLLFPCKDLLLCKGHLLLHDGDFLLGSPSVLLEEGPKVSETKIWTASVESVIFRMDVSHLSALVCMFDTVEHGPELSQPLSIHCRHTLHVLLKHKHTCVSSNCSPGHWDMNCPAKKANTLLYVHSCIKHFASDCIIYINFFYFFCGNSYTLYYFYSSRTN